MTAKSAHIDGDPNNNDPADPDVARDGSGQSRQSAYRARRVAAGSVQKSFLLPADVVEKLERLGVVYGSQTKAIEAAIIALSASKDEWRDDFDNAPSQACIAVPYGSRWSFHHAHWDDQQDAWLDIYSDRILNPRYWFPLPTTSA